MFSAQNGTIVRAIVRPAGNIAASIWVEIAKKRSKRKKMKLPSVLESKRDATCRVIVRKVCYVRVYVYSVG